MGRLLVLMIGLTVGLALAGIGAGLLIPQLPAGYRTQWIVMLAAAVIIATCVGLAIVMMRPRRS